VVVTWACVPIWLSIKLQGCQNLAKEPILQKSSTLRKKKLWKLFALQADFYLFFLLPLFQESNWIERYHPDIYKNLICTYVYKNTKFVLYYFTIYYLLQFIIIYFINMIRNRRVLKWSFYQYKSNIKINQRFSSNFTNTRHF